jgi:glycosyltransferase involved in cell wall biosynthesis
MSSPQSSSNKSLVSVVTPSYNSSSTILSAIESVLDQDPTIPYVIVDDCSTDGIPYRLETFPSVIFIENAINLGSSSTRNIGLGEVNTPYVIFLDADDYILPKTIDTLHQVVLIDQPDIIYFPWFKKNGDGVITGPFMNGCSNPTQMFHAWLDGRFVPPCAVIWRVDYLKKIGSWGEGLRYNDDGELALRALLHNPRISVATTGGGVYLKGVNSESVSNAKLEVKIKTNIQIFRSIRNLINNLVEDEKTKAELSSKMGEAMYHFARIAYQSNKEILAEVALISSREFGFKGYIGSTSYRLLAQILGLRFAEHAADMYNKWRY